MPKGANDLGGTLRKSRLQREHDSSIRSHFNNQRRGGRAGSRIFPVNRGLDRTVTGSTGDGVHGKPDFAKLFGSNRDGEIGKARSDAEDHKPVHRTRPPPTLANRPKQAAPKDLPTSDFLSRLLSTPNLAGLPPRKFNPVPTISSHSKSSSDSNAEEKGDNEEGDDDNQEKNDWRAPTGSRMKTNDTRGGVVVERLEAMVEEDEDEEKQDQEPDRSDEMEMDGTGGGEDVIYDERQSMMISDEEGEEDEMMEDEDHYHSSTPPPTHQIQSNPSRTSSSYPRLKVNPTSTPMDVQFQSSRAPSHSHRSIHSALDIQPHIESYDYRNYQHQEEINYENIYPEDEYQDQNQERFEDEQELSLSLNGRGIPEWCEGFIVEEDGKFDEETGIGLGLGNEVMEEMVAVGETIPVGDNGSQEINSGSLIAPPYSTDNKEGSGQEGLQRIPHPLQQLATDLIDHLQDGQDHEAQVDLTPAEHSIKPGPKPSRHSQINPPSPNIVTQPQQPISNSSDKSEVQVTPLSEQAQDQHQIVLHQEPKIEGAHQSSKAEPQEEVEQATSVSGPSLFFGSLVEDDDDDEYD